MASDLLFFDHHLTIAEFLAENVGKTVNVRIGEHMWYQWKVLSVDKESDKLEYRSDEFPAGTGMLMSHLDEVREMNAIV